MCVIELTQQRLTKSQQKLNMTTTICFYMLYMSWYEYNKIIKYLVKK